jgi:hypothetical protein
MREWHEKLIIIKVNDKIIDERYPVSVTEKYEEETDNTVEARSGCIMRLIKLRCQLAT